MKKITIEEINEKIENEPEKYISRCEAQYLKSLEAAAAAIASVNGRRLVMLAGPSSSGKTTTALFLANILKEKYARKCVTVSLDDFYLENDKIPLFDDGRPDFETVYALDIPMITACLSRLLENGSADMPIFDFNSKSRSKESLHLEIGDKDVVIVEGLHALNPIITSPLEKESMIKLYVNVVSRVFDGDKVIFARRDIRFIRRMIRDYKFRNSSVGFTFYLWKGVKAGEERYLFPFSQRADIQLDSFHPYELCVYKELASELLSHIEKTSDYYGRACELKSKLSLLSAITAENVPKGSLLCEFLGKGEK